MLKLPRPSSKMFQLIRFIGRHNGVRAVDVEKHLVIELQGKEWDPKRRCGAWNISLYDYGHRALYPTYCVKGSDKLWRLSPEARDALVAYYNTQGIGTLVWGADCENKLPPPGGFPKTSLEADLPSDEIEGVGQTTVDRIEIPFFDGRPDGQEFVSINLSPEMERSYRVCTENGRSYLECKETDPHVLIRRLQVARSVLEQAQNDLATAKINADAARADVDNIAGQLRELLEI